MTKTVSQIRDELADREAIRDCLYRYCRASDRADGELFKTAYWPGALDHHTGFDGTVEEYVKWVMPRMKEMGGGVHLMGNILIELDGDKAAVESYWWSVSVMPGDRPREVFVCGRYLDRFEKRNDEWRIAERMVVHDWFNENATTGDWSIGPFNLSDLARGKRMAEDPSRTWLGMRR